MMNPGRNDPCPCGSGKKFKRCCGINGAQPRMDQSGLARREPIVAGDGPDISEATRRQKMWRLEEAQRVFQMGLALAMQGNPAQAMVHYERALALRPDFADAHINMGAALAAQGKSAQAVAHYERALALRPDFADAHSNLANVLAAQGKTVQAVSHLERALALRPDYVEAHNNLGLALAALGKPAQAVVHFERALALRPDYVEAHSNLLLTLNYTSCNDLVSVYNAHLDFARRREAALAALIQAHANDRSPERRLKVGYVSSDFRQHSVSHFIEPVLENHDRDRFEIFCYYNNFQEDEVTKRLESRSDRWRNIIGMSDESVAKQIRADQIDILVDLNGHTANNRLLVFAQKPAPIQVTWLGYPNTTGLSTMDYRLTDEFADPVGMTEHIHSETLVRLPESFSCYRQPREAPEESELPALARGYVTFGSFNNFKKVTPEVMAVWARILQAIPGSRLMLKNSSLSEGTMQQAVRETFAELGVAPEQLELLGQDRSQNAHLERYRDIDIGLDPFPYNGTTTNCEALWMGVPVVTLAGRTHAARVGVSEMSNLGLTDLICHTPEEYIATALRLSADLERLSALRKELRTRMAASPLMDAQRFTKNLEQTYLTMWQDWCLKA
ncbi:MAG: tetratricopeptide repeat protein [Proteobacteria bacterium]|nr:tetratricopeptide repeat protein [Pseudomonadota bacterium]